MAVRSGKSLLFVALISLLCVTTTLCDSDGDSHDDDEYGNPKKDCDKEKKEGSHGSLSGLKIAAGVGAVVLVIVVVAVCIIKKKCLHKRQVRTANTVVLEKIPEMMDSSPEKKGPLPPEFAFSPPGAPEQPPPAPPSYLEIDLNRMEMPPPYEKIPSTVVYTDPATGKGNSVFP